VKPGFVKPGQIKPVFPPPPEKLRTEEGPERIRWGLWREQGVMLSIVVYALLRSLHLMFSAYTLQGLSLACADSKRRRRPALFRPLHPIPK
jgi:hypothetical protein